ncbi:hypothetical protein ONZ45_g6105 [Pleurotus djamor]|nr:hypothetical protein ONZ45_g6105 [Pleurotus djamor]
MLSRLLKDRASLARSQSFITSVPRAFKPESNPEILPPPRTSPVETDFLNLLNSVNLVGSTSWMVFPFIGPFGPYIAPSASAVLSAIVGLEPFMSRKENYHPAPGIADRAMLAEASLQAVLNIYKHTPNHPVLGTVLQDMSNQYSAHAPNIYEIAKALTPLLLGRAVTIAEYMSARAYGRAYGSELDSRARQALCWLPWTTEWSTNDSADAFLQGLNCMTLPVFGAEADTYNFLGGLISRAVTPSLQPPLPLVSQASKDALSTVLPHILDYSNIDNMGPWYHDASTILCQRALLADAALSSLRRLSCDQLDQFTLRAGVPQQEGDIFDFIKSVLQKLGPYSRLVAQSSISEVMPNLLDAVDPRRKMRFTASEFHTHPNLYRCANPDASYRYL